MSKNQLELTINAVKNMHFKENLRFLMIGRKMSDPDSAAEKGPIDWSFL